MHLDGVLSVDLLRKVEIGTVDNLKLLTGQIACATFVKRDPETATAKLAKKKILCRSRFSRGLMEEGVKSVKREYDISNFAEKILQRALRTINKNINLLSEKWALESQVANKEKDAIDNYILGTKHS
ncbi:7389_t:CDS:2 [Entrophospora sp. SA101]|nr:7389_t:CDS:2 [Entrophospora sp. SA101]